ncbi:GGDEF domain-containing protein [Marinobacterium sp. MBR-109]|jgi:diguanylate cyclase|uniref:sensor domain-containing diguanylate cyclase n=1 Tax=Marinobacterium sp. MBR-109 TaxID=3156462 RepID=UPI0033994B5B
MTDKVDWRGKYRALALEVEQHEQQHAQAAECLRNLAIQLDLAVHGQSATLDQLLASLVAELQAGKLDAVPDLLRKTEKHVRLLDETRAQQARQLIKRIDEWVLLLQGTAESQAGTLVEVRQKLAGTADNMQQLPGLIDTLLTFQRQNAYSDSDTVSADDLAQPGDVISSRMAQRLLELIQLFNVPAQHRARTHELISRLEAGPGSEELEQCLEEVSVLARACGGNVGADIQAYLVGLSEQLAYLRSFLDKAETADTVQLQRNNLLDQTVRHDVQKISQTVKLSSDIDELKTAVSTQLASLIKAVNTHRRAEDQHIAELKRERQGLMSRLDEMEQKAAGFRRSAEEAHMKSRTDPLTGLANRFAYDQQLVNELARYQRYGTPFALCVADIDFFKGINDQYGHLAGDKVLRLMAKVLRSSLRGVDFVARFGGEEFVILMPSTGGKSAHQAAEKVRKAVEQSPFNFQSRPVHITVSIGVAEVMSDDTGESLFGRADSNLYAAKSNGRNRVVMH